MKAGSPTLVQCPKSLNVGVGSNSTEGNGGSNSNATGGSDRRRRSGLTAVMQRPGIKRIYSHFWNMYIVYLFIVNVDLGLIFVCHFVVFMLKSILNMFT